MRRAFDDAAEAGGRRQKPEWLRRIEEGNQFNREREAFYPHNEVYIEKPDGNGYYRLDSYNPDLGEIVSRKHTQLSEIQEGTAIRYLDELESKYPPGARIAEVPSSGDLGGEVLSGDLILEVPVQNSEIPRNVLDAANDRDIIIRDVDGRVYNP